MRGTRTPRARRPLSPATLAVLLLAFLALIALGSFFALTMDHRNLPRNMKLTAFAPHRPHFSCVIEADVVPTPSAEAEAFFQQGLATTSYELPPAERNYAEAARLWEQAAAMGHWKAALNLAGLFEEGQGVPEDTERAVQIVEQLMNQGVPSAFDRMGSFHARGIGVNSDIDRAYAFWQLAADKGSAAAQGFIGYKLIGAYDNPGQGFWANDKIGLRMLKCGYAQEDRYAAFKLGGIVNIDPIRMGETREYALQVLHDGVKFGCTDCASYLSASFDEIEPLTGNTIDKDRSDRYHTLGDALRSNPDLRFPNLDKVLPLPPAELPQWDGELDSLVDAAKAVIPVPPPRPTPGSQRTGRAHIPNGYMLARTTSPQPPREELLEVDPRRANEHVVVADQPDGATVPFSGYWLPQLTQAVHDWKVQWNERQLPQHYAKDETFELIDRKGMGDYARVTNMNWHYQGEAVQVPQAPTPPRVVQGVARLSAEPQPPLTCVGALPCPRSGIWLAQVSDKHPRAKSFNRWDRQAYVREGESFPALDSAQPDVNHLQVEPHHVTWRWLANANEADFAGVEQLTLTPPPARV